MSTPIGIVLAFIGIFASVVMEGGNPAAFFAEPAPLVLVIFGTLGASMASIQLKDLGASFKALLKAMKGFKADSAAIIEELVSFADTARREGLLALEEKVKAVEDPFLKRGLELVIDGSDPEAVEDTLFAELGGLRERHKVTQTFWTAMGGFSPTLGVIGTVAGLLHVLENLADPSKLGPLIAGAFIATLWGVMLANIIYLPVAGKLKRDSTAEVAYKELIIQGVLSIQAGSSPRSVGERLKSYLPPKQREAEAKDKKSA
jgi:chemotaxis protein MotA